MPELKKFSIDKLHLDLANYRATQQKTEIDAINTMININPDWFWSLMENIIEDGYYPTENIIVLEQSRRLIVKEGNRRIASLKMIYEKITGVDFPENIQTKIKNITKAWKSQNKTVSCSVYQENEIENVKKIISLIHAKEEKAGRDPWTAVARARYDRNEKGSNEPALDLLEKYVNSGKNISSEQKERWSGDYPLTVLDELLPKLFPLLKLSSREELISVYPQKNRSEIEGLLFDIGMNEIGFKEIRDKKLLWLTKYGFKVVNKDDEPFEGNQSGKKDEEKKYGKEEGEDDSDSEKKSEAKPQSPSKKRKSLSLTDSKSVTKKLKKFNPVGEGREKVVTLLDEMKRLKIEDHPYSFCFLLRSLFEISAKAYCEDHKSTGGPKPTEKNGQDRKLATLLNDIVKHMTNNKKDIEKTRILHGAITEIAKEEGVLSITSINQLVHGRIFSVLPNDICMLFWNIFPLLEEMNK